MRPTIFTFNLNENRLTKLRFICFKLGILVKPVPPERFDHHIATLIGLSEPETEPSANTFSDEMLLFYNLSDHQLNTFLATCKQQRFAPVALKAIVTPDNTAWTAVELHAELWQERQAVLQGNTAGHEA